MPLSYTIDEACKLCSIGRTKLYQIISDGSLPAKKIGKRTIILHDDLTNFLSDLENFSSRKSEKKKYDTFFY